LHKTYASRQLASLPDWKIEAVDEDGFDEHQVRTVTENARTLKFEQSGFEQA